MRAVVRSHTDLYHWCEQVSEKIGDFDKPWTVSIRRFHRPRTTPQNAIFHAMCTDLGEHCGYTQAEIKEYVKSEHGFRKTIEIGGVMKDIPMGTSEMSVEQLSFLIEELYRIGAEVNCVYQEAEHET